MAGDLQFTEGTFKWRGKTKIYRFPAHPRTFGECDFIGGFAGTASSMVSVIEFFTMPDLFKPPKVTGISGLILTAKGEIFVFDNYDKWIAINQPFAAIGSGGAIATGAMSAGCTPLEAVKIAAKHDAATGMGTKVLRFE